MDKNLLEQQKNKLLKEKDRIIGQLKEMTQETSFDKNKVQAKWSEVGDKDEDNAVEVANFQDSISLERDLETSLERIEKALKRIEQGNYGQCEGCSKEIGDERLVACPEAVLCLACAAR